MYEILSLYSINLYGTAITLASVHWRSHIVTRGNLWKPSQSSPRAMDCGSSKSNAGKLQSRKPLSNENWPMTSKRKISLTTKYREKRIRPRSRLHGLGKKRPDLISERLLSNLHDTSGDLGLCFSQLDKKYTFKQTSVYLLRLHQLKKLRVNN